MKSIQNATISFHERLLVAAIGFGTPMPDKQTRRRDMAPTQAAGAQAEIVLLAIPFTEGIFVKLARLCETGTFDIEAVAYANGQFHHPLSIHLTCNAIDLCGLILGVRSPSLPGIARYGGGF